MIVLPQPLPLKPRGNSLGRSFMPLKTISTDLLRTLAVAAGGETLTDVARRVGRSQPAISLRIKKLEDELGTQLVRRTSRGAELTEAGHLVHSYAKRILQLNDDMVAAVAGLRVDGDLRLGLPADLAETWLSQALAAFTTMHPHVHLEVIVDRNQVLIEQVKTGELDLAIALTETPPTDAELLQDLPICWIGRPGQTHAGDTEVPLVLFAAPCMFRRSGITALEQSDRRWRVSMTSPSLAGLWAAVEAGLGISLRTPIGVPPSLSVLESPDLPALNTTAYLAIYRAPSGGGTAVEALCQIARDTLSKQTHITT